jgi:hypothetical protein
VSAKRPALVPESLPAYPGTRLTNAQAVATSTSLLRELTTALPNSRAIQATLDHLPASQPVPIDATRNAIPNGTMLIKHQLTGRAPKVEPGEAAQGRPSFRAARGASSPTRNGLRISGPTEPSSFSSNRIAPSGSWDPSSVGAGRTPRLYRMVGFAFF